jgi:putative endonuclease
MFKVYILESQITLRYYIGHCADLEVRLQRHNKGLVRSTKPFRPWVVIYTEDFKTKNEAYKRELEIKSYKGGNAFRKLIKN